MNCSDINPSIFLSVILGHSHAAHPIIQIDSLAPAPSTVTSSHPPSSSCTSAPAPVPTSQPPRFVRLSSSLLQTLSQSQVLPYFSTSQICEAFLLPSSNSLPIPSSPLLLNLSDL
ncbi:hypothetical protein M8J77_006285 [Diaphorina citri]|nr:hypothetical protein M8J77_006285 [Diaphorina citri]